MVNYYSNQPVSYGYQPVTNMPTYESHNKKTGPIPYALGGLAIGAGSGALIGWNKNPFISKSGEVSENFARKALDIFINKKDDSAKKIYNEASRILEGLKKVKTPDDLKSLLNDNKTFAKNMCEELRQTPDEYIRTITKDNLQASKDAISARINGSNKDKTQSFKNKIQACWDKTTKKFKKSNNVSQDAFDAINEATDGCKTRLITKYAVIGGISATLATLIGYYLIKVNKAKKQAQTNVNTNVQTQNINFS